MNDSTELFKKWTQDEIDCLTKKYAKETAASIAQRLDRTLASVTSKAAYLGLEKSGRSTWKSRELEYLRENYKELSIREIAKHLNRLPGVIRQKLYKMKLYK